MNHYYELLASTGFLLTMAGTERIRAMIVIEHGAINDGCVPQSQVMIAFSTETTNHVLIHPNDAGSWILG